MPSEQDPAVPATDTAAAAGEPVDRLELLFEARVARALDRLGVPRGEQIRELTALLERLTERIDSLGAIVVPPARAATTDEPAGGAASLVKRAASPRRSRRSPAAAATNPKARR